MAVPTLHDMKYKLARALNEVELLEVLEITSEDIVERFSDFIEEKFDFLSEELEDIPDED